MEIDKFSITPFHSTPEMHNDFDNTPLCNDCHIRPHLQWNAICNERGSYFIFFVISTKIEIRKRNFSIVPARRSHLCFSHRNNNVQIYKKKRKGIKKTEAKYGTK